MVAMTAVVVIAAAAVETEVEVAIEGWLGFRIHFSELRICRMYIASE